MKLLFKISQYFLFLILVFLLTFIDLKSQLLIPQSVIESNKLNENSSFYEIRDAMERYWHSMRVINGMIELDGVSRKAAGWKIYKRWEYFWEQRVNQQTGEFPKTNSANEHLKYMQNWDGEFDDTDFFESWSNMGTNYSEGGYAGLGRINCVAFHPTDANSFWVGSPSGGIWRTSNGGVNWTILNNSEDVLGVSDIAIPSDFATSNTIYIATGDRDGGSLSSLSGGQNNDNNSIGILKSTDGGATWNTTGFSYNVSEGRKIYRILLHPSNSSILLISTSQGVFKSTDAGNTWVLKSISSSRFRDMQFKPDDPTIVYVGRVQGAATYVYRSTNTGETFTSVALPTSLNYASQIRLAVTAAAPNLVYVYCEDGQVYKSTDAGASYFHVNTNVGVNMLGYFSDGSGFDSQASYDLCLACSPSDSNIVYAGGITTWKSTDGGVTWANSNMWTSHNFYNSHNSPVVHADKHILTFQSGNVLFEGNDGGVYKTIDGGTTWTDLSNGLVISQIYRIGVSQSDHDIVLAGLQDNGSKKYQGNLNTWFDATGGDGMECIIDYNDATSYMYATYVRGTIYRNSNGFSNQSISTISENIPGGQPNGAWVTPYIMHSVNSAILFAGYDKVWKTTNRGDNWSSASQVLSATDKLRSLAMCASDPNTIYAADRTNMWKTIDGGLTNWSTVTLPTTTDYLTYIRVKNNDPNTLWITFGGYSNGSKVFKSTNGGGSWINISAGLPNLPVMCIEYDKEYTDVDVLFAGTDVGVYFKDGELDWVPFSNGLPNVVVTELEIAYGSGMWADKLRAGTFGRGLWETELSNALPIELISFVSSVNGNNVTLRWSTATEINNQGFEIQRSTEAGIWQRAGSVAGNGNSSSTNQYTFTDKNLSTGRYSYRLKQIDYNGTYRFYDLIGDVIIGLPSAFNLAQNYPNPFNPTTKIQMELPLRSLVSLKVYDITGSEVAIIENGELPAGYHTLEFNASHLSSGVYVYVMRAGNFRIARRMILIR
ncbi:MAG: hypothetical protein HGGPFJEG_00263 [Ignavibacteria bacterium]|nr:hypothetical protein [Ignavibacteria bacterium]